MKFIFDEIAKAASRLGIDISNDDDYDALLNFADDFEVYGGDGYDGLMDGKTDAQHFLSLALNLAQYLDEVSGDEKAEFAAQVGLLVGLVNGVIGDDRTKHVCPTCIESAYASKLGEIGANAKYAKDPKQKAKAFAKECWEEWQANPNRYKNKVKFVEDVLTKIDTDDQGNPIVTYSTVYIKWIPEWERQKKQQKKV